MMLHDLIQDLPVTRILGDLEVSIQGITHDSRRVQEGSLFVAIPGAQQDGHHFVEEAIKRGAKAVVLGHELDLQVPQVIVGNPREALAHVSARFYGDPSTRLRVIGVTGTNGKTTFTYLMESILKMAGRKPAVMGTVNYRLGDKIMESEHTTPESVDLQRFFSQCLEEGVTDVVMEVSSHALSQGRVRGVHFDVVAFTNLTQDHLDYHADLEDYFDEKKRLFTEYLMESGKKNKFAVINVEDPRSEILLQETVGMKVRVGLTGPYEVSCRSFDLSAEGIHAQMCFGSEEVEIRSSLIGLFNLENILVAAGVATSLGIDTATIRKGIEAMSFVPGRLEKIPNNRNIHLFVDYAHTPDALARVGANLRKFLRGRLITVFGCGGDRDRTKRALMGREAGQMSDWVIVTSDNPRTEDPEVIIDQILQGLDAIGFPKEKILRIPDREEALQRAVKMARSGDFVLVAGKGHEDYQIIGKKKIPFSDQEILRKFFTEK